MKKAFVYCGALAALAFGACKKENKPAEGENPLSAATTILPSNGTLPLTIESGDTVRLNFNGSCANSTYFLDGKCYVKNGGVIVLQAGVVLKGVSKSTPEAASALVITRGGRIFADGTAERPVTFTSTVDSVGGWGGLVILGRAQVNKSNPAIEGIDLPTLPPGVDVTYGGTNGSDNSGRLTYVRILNAGANVSANNELNGLTLGGVGSGTSIHHIYVAKGRDDAFEMFGGTVRLTHIIADSPNDDCFDFDFGYRGAIQFALAFVKSSNNTFNGDANGIESDNDGTGSADAPQTRAVISNMTIIGGNTAAVAGTLHGNRWRRNTSLIVYNSIVMGYNIGEKNETAETDTLELFKYNLVHGFNDVVDPGILDPTNQQYLGGGSNATIALNGPFGTFVSGGTFDARPNATTSPARNGANFSEIAAFGFTTTTYRGAFNPSASTSFDWAAFAFAGCN